MNVIALFDIGKTNKKLLLFDEDYRIVREDSRSFGEIRDEDGDPCDDLIGISDWVVQSLRALRQEAGLHVRAVNFSAYGASFVHIDRDGRPLTPLYNYLKPYPSGLREQFYAAYGGEEALSLCTASPVLGSLNSGMQLYRLKYRQPSVYAAIRYSLHLPQYLHYLVTGMAWSDITSIGCHTHLWDFSRQQYHNWVYREGIINKLAPLSDASMVLPVTGNPELVAGTGLHDSSAAMIPYFESFRDPFVLISTGTWCISMNPFSRSPLTAEELAQDCLCYLSYQGQPVKASRLFAGQEHEQETRRIADFFGKPADYHRSVAYDPAIVEALREAGRNGADAFSEERGKVLGSGVFAGRDLGQFAHYEAAYHQLLLDIMDQQVRSTRLVLKDGEVRRIFVDGGFGRNPVYMHLLAAAFPEMEVYAAAIPQATALGAALALHSHWNDRSLPGDIIDLKYYK